MPGRRPWPRTWTARLASRRELAMAAVKDRLVVALEPVPVWRNSTLPRELPDPGLVIVTDGEVSEPDVTLGVRHWSWAADADIACWYASDDADQRSSAVDELAQAVVQALEADRSLGGLVDRVSAFLESVTHNPTEGREDLVRADVALTLFYQTATAAG
jgi:hypothetical protein